jgi:hypothetical protein
MSNLLQTAIPAPVTFLGLVIRVPSAAPAGSAEHPGGHGYARRSPGRPPKPSSITWPTVRDLVVGANAALEPRATRRLKGLEGSGSCPLRPGEWEPS